MKWKDLLIGVLSIAAAVVFIGVVSQTKHLTQAKKETAAWKKLANKATNTALEAVKERKAILAKYKAVIKLPNEQLTEFIAIFVKDRQPRVSTDVANLISKAVVKYSNEHDLPPGLLVGIIEAESRYDPMALSSARARGLMQIMFKVWGKALKIKGYKELYEIDPNIKYGSRILKILLKQEGSLSKALSKYLGTTKSGKYRAGVLSTFAEFELDKHRFLNIKPTTKEKPEDK